MEEKNIFCDDIESLDEKERTKDKNKKNYTISEIQIFLNQYEKCGQLRDTTNYFDISHSTLSGLIKRKDDYLTTNR